MIYTLTIPDPYVVGLTDMLAQSNAQSTQRRQPVLEDVNAFLIEAVLTIARQGINNIAANAAKRVAAIAMDSSNSIESDALIAAVQAYAKASPEQQTAIRGLLGI
jgi:hypothetical protein